MSDNVPDFRYGSKIENKPVDISISGAEKLLSTDAGSNKTLNIIVNDLVSYIAWILNLEYFVDFIDPEGNNYPSTIGETQGAYWLVSGLSSPWLFTSGALSGQTVNNGYKLLSDGEQGLNGEGLSIIIPPSGTWGAIFGNINDQTDLIALLTTKQDSLGLGSANQLLSTNPSATGFLWVEKTHWRNASVDKSIDLAENGFENDNYAIAGVTIGDLNTLGSIGGGYDAYGSIIIGHGNSNNAALYSLMTGAKGLIDVIDGSYIVMNGFGNKVRGLTTLEGEMSFVAGAFNSLKGFRNVSFGGVSTVADPDNPAKYLEIEGFSNFNISLIDENSTKGIVKGLANFISGWNQEINNTGTEFCAILGGRDHIINGVIKNSVVLGGKAIAVTEDDTAYVEKLSIKTVGSTPVIKALGVDASGRVVESAISVGMQSITWADLVLLQGSSGINVGDTFQITTGGFYPNEQILINAKDQNGESWFTRTDIFGNESKFYIQ